MVKLRVLSKSTKEKLAKHAKKHTKNHIAIMKRFLRRGLSWAESHKLALQMDKVPLETGSRITQRVHIKIGEDKQGKPIGSTKTIYQGSPFVQPNNTDGLYNRIASQREEANARQNAAYNAL